MNGRILFSLGTDWLSSFVRLIDGHDFSHSEILHTDGRVICSTHPRGVIQLTMRERMEACALWAIYEVENSDGDAVWELASRKLGAGYDLWGALAIPFRIRGVEDPRQYWCSELVAVVYDEAGTPITRTDRSRISLRPLLESVRTREIARGHGAKFNPEKHAFRNSP